MLPDRNSRLAEEAAFLESFCLGRSEGEEEEEEFLRGLVEQNEKVKKPSLLPRLPIHPSYHHRTLTCQNAEGAAQA